MIANVCLVLALGAPQRVADAQGVRAFEFEPGREWVFEGTIEQRSSGEDSAEGRHSFRLRYLALDETAAGEKEILLLRTLEPGTWRYGEKETETERSEAAVSLVLGSDLRLKPARGARYWNHPAAPYLELFPFPPADAPRGPGESVERDEATKTMWEAFPGGAIWTAVREESGVRVTCEPRRLPASCGCEEKETTLEAYRETYLLHPVSGVAREYERSWKTRSASEENPGTEEVKLALHLVETRAMAPGELAVRRSELASIRSLREKIEAPEADLEAAQKQVEALVAGLAGSPLLAAASDLEQAIDRAKSSREDMAREKAIQERLLDKPAPDFASKDLDGKEIRLSELRGKVVLLNFWASW